MKRDKRKISHTTCTLLFSAVAALFVLGCSRENAPPPAQQKDQPQKPTAPGENAADAPQQSDQVDADADAPEGTATEATATKTTATEDFCAQSQFPESCSSPLSLLPRGADPQAEDLGFQPVMEPYVTAVLMRKKIQNNIDDEVDGATMTCQNLKTLISTTFQWDLQHAGVSHPLRQKLMSRALELYLSELDFLKLYFLEEDVKDIIHLYSGTLWQEIAQGNCRILREIQARYDTYYQSSYRDLYYAAESISQQDIDNIHKEVEASLSPNSLQQASTDSGISPTKERIKFATEKPTRSHFKDKLLFVIRAVINDYMLSFWSYEEQIAQLHGRQQSHHIRGAFQYLLRDIKEYLNVEQQGELFYAALPEAVRSVILGSSGHNAWKEEVPYLAFSQAFFLAYEEQNLTCGNVTDTLEGILGSHLNTATVDQAKRIKITPQMSRDALEHYMEKLDPGALYFLQSDRDDILGRYGASLRSYLLNNQCQPLLEIGKLYAQRVRERYPLIKANIFKEHDYSLDETVPKIVSASDFPTAQNLKEHTRKNMKALVVQSLRSLPPGSSIAQAQRKAFDDMKKHRNQLDQLTSSDLYRRFTSSFLGTLDYFTDLLWAEYADSFNILTFGTLSGIGVSVDAQGDYPRIEALNKGGGAEKSGLLKVGDVVTAVRQDVTTSLWEHATDIGFNEMLKRIRGPADTFVHLRIRRPLSTDEESPFSWHQFDVRLRRSTIFSDTLIAPHHLFSVQHSLSETPVKVGWIKVNTFVTASRMNGHGGSAYEIGSALQNLKEQGADVAILDVRYNPGGDLNETLRTLSLFARPQTLLRTKGVRSAYQDDHTGDIVLAQEYIENLQLDNIGEISHDHLHIPLVVLVTRDSASASEVLAQAMRDHGRGIVVGEDFTKGKGSIQGLVYNALSPTLWNQRMAHKLYDDSPDELAHNLFPELKDFHLAKITYGLYFGASGSSPQKIGVSSDVELPVLSAIQGRWTERHNKRALPHSTLEGEDLSVDLGFRSESLIEQLKAWSHKRVNQHPLLSQWDQLAQKYKMKEPTDDSPGVMSLQIKNKAELTEEEQIEADGKASLQATVRALSDLQRSFFKQQDTDPEIAESIRKEDHFLNEALHVAADYFILCRGASATKPKDLEQDQTKVVGCTTTEEQEQATQSIQQEAQEEEELRNDEKNNLEDNPSSIEESQPLEEMPYVDLK